MNSLRLNAYGGTVAPGDPCWLFDTEEFTITPVPAARLVEVQPGSACLLHEGRVYKCYRVAASEEVARDMLRRTAEIAWADSRDRAAKAERFLSAIWSAT